jgi:hypothetical protein
VRDIITKVGDQSHGLGRANVAAVDVTKAKRNCMTLSVPIQAQIAICYIQTSTAQILPLFLKVHTRGIAGYVSDLCFGTQMHERC